MQHVYIYSTFYLKLNFYRYGLLEIDRGMCLILIFYTALSHMHDSLGEIGGVPR